MHLVKTKITCLIYNKQKANNKNSFTYSQALTQELLSMEKLSDKSTKIWKSLFFSKFKSSGTWFC